MVLIEGRSREHAKRVVEETHGQEPSKLARTEPPLPVAAATGAPPGGVLGLGGLPALTGLPVPGLGVSPPPFAAPMPTMGMGQFDLFAHLAASARMSAAMAAASNPPEEEREEAQGPAAFDKDALMRLARQATEAEQQPRPPPQTPWAASTGPAVPMPGTALAPVLGPVLSPGLSPPSAVLGPALAAGCPGPSPCGCMLGAPQPTAPAAPAGPPGLMGAVPEVVLAAPAVQVPHPPLSLPLPAPPLALPSPTPGTAPGVPPPAQPPPPVPPPAPPVVPQLPAAPVGEALQPVAEALRPPEVPAPADRTAAVPVPVLAPSPGARVALEAQEIAATGPTAELAAAGSAPNWATASKPPETEGRKKDASSVASLLQQAQDNVARGRSAGASKGEGPALQLQQAFGSGVPGASGSGALENLLHRLESAAGASEAVRRELEEEVLETLPRLEPARAAELIVRAHATQGLQGADFLDDLARSLAPSVSRFGSPHLIRILGTVAAWAIVEASSEDGRPRLSEDVRAFFTAASAELSLRLMDVAPRDLSHIATAMASVGLTEERFFASLARAAVARSDRFLPEEIMALASAFDRACLVHTPLLEALARCLRNNIKEVTPRELLRGLKALATCCVRDGELGKAVGDHLQVRAKGLMAAEEFCSVAWTFCTLGFYHDHMFRAVFHALEDAPVMASDTLCQLYEIHVALKAFRQDLYRKYELEEDAVQSLRTHYKKHRGGRMREHKLERCNEKVHKDVADTLKYVVEGTIHKQHQTELGLSVDVAVTRRRSTSVLAFVEVDGPHSLMRSLDPAAPQLGHASRVRGSVLLKRYVLQKHGFRMAVISEDLWRSLVDSREKRDFLREMLRNVGVSQARLI